MAIDVTVSAQVPDDVQVLGVPVFAGRRQPDKAAIELDVGYLAERGFEGKVGEACAMPVDDGSTVVALGMGKPDEVSPETFRRAGAAFAKAAWNDVRAAIAVLDAAGELDKGAAAKALAEGAILSAYRFTKYKNEAKPSKLESLVIVGRGAKVQTGADRGARIAEAVSLARDL